MPAASRALRALAAGLVAAGAAAAAAPAPELALSLRPVADRDGEISRIEVAIRIDADGPVRLRLPHVVANVPTAAPAAERIEARDADGTLALSERDEGEAGARARVWTTERAVRGPLSYGYAVPIENRLAPRGAAPPLELRADAGGFSGAGSTFLILPEGEESYRLSLAWDLSALPEGSAALSSLGAGDVVLAVPEGAGRLANSFFMAGRIGRFPPAEGAGLFFAGWQAEPPFAPERLMAWAADLHARFIAFFRDEDPRPYGVFLRPNPVNAGGGVGLAGSFVATFDGATDADDLRFTLAHEMFHTFSPRLNVPSGLESSWFTEGLAVFYQRELPFRFGMVGPDEYLDNLNRTAARYYTSAMASVPNAEIPARFWEDTRIRTLPYDRGALYFAELDHRLRAASGGRRSLDDLVLAMVERQRAGATLGHADWEALLAEAGGPDEVARFRAMLSGTPPLPPSGAFGPCFRRTVRPLRRYELGFDPRVLVEQPRIVRGLVPGSAAAVAGLRDGDEIMRPVPQDSIQGDQQAMLRLEIRRGERQFPIAYLPRGETVDAYQWERIEDVPDSACRR